LFLAFFLPIFYLTEEGPFTYKLGRLGDHPL